MQLRRVGKSALEIPPIILGGMFRDPTARQGEIDRALDRGLDLGLCAIDTAPLYEFGESEALLGRFLKSRRAQVCVMTKVGLRWDDDWGEILFSADVQGQLRVVRRDSRPEAIRRDVEESLARLGCETLDLVQVHHRDPQTPIAETMGELVRLRGEGKVREIGVSNYSARELVEAQDALGDLPLASTQNDYSLIERTPEQALLPAARSIGCVLLAYSPLAQGLLAGRMLDGTLPASDGRLQGALYQPGNVALINGALRDVLRPVAERAQSGLAQVSLAWVIAQPGVGGAIVGAQNEAQVEVAAAATRLELRHEELEALDQAFSALSLDRSAGVSRRRRAIARLRRLFGRILR